MEPRDRRDRRDCWLSSEVISEWSSESDNRSRLRLKQLLLIRAICFWWMRDTFGMLDSW